MKVFIKTYGCSFNQSDSEIMTGALGKKGHEIVSSIKDADLVLINSCTVKNSAESKFWKDVRSIQKPKVLAGCVPEADTDKSRYKDYSVISTKCLGMAAEVAEKTLAGEVVHATSKTALTRTNMPRQRKNPMVDIVPINEGCLGSCSFCKTKFARGHLHSYPLKDIVQHVRDALNSRAEEIWLTSQDTACYGYDIGTNLIELLKEILKLKRDFKIRLGMGNPDFLPDYAGQLAELFRDPRMFKFLHIPLQSGSDNVLKAMKRNYNASRFEELVSLFRKYIPEMTFATDIIIGFPGETEEDFAKTLEVLEKTKPDVINLSKYWARPGTVSAKLKLLPTETVKARSLEIKSLFADISKENNRKWLGWTGEVLIDEVGTKNTFVGRNLSYKPIVMKGDFTLGQKLKVKIVDTTVFDLRAVPL
ncbi:MAG: tRNA (N(6)-L-threonylcarbamoyladenosine(37)-C(2))-methylthiotransferase [Nanoarchaeota archaeon]|nr:tRNA (N(6)-L-threonylcarbamoyladenosine(37)-C(2))-methylthiotransferase [Nanoarchaeota archaeon]